MTFSHRPVEMNDIHAICSFPASVQELFFFFPKARWPLSPEQLMVAINERVDNTVVVDDGQVVGFANFYRWGAEACAIGNVIVSPHARGKGVGRYLIQTMVEKASAQHLTAKVTLSCFNENVAGLLLYSQIGFEPYAIEARSDHDGAPVALIHLKRECRGD
ncbi:GNAT family acetyltransferase [Chania multitudinisentens RB-25]|uniref:GNAT family acetyltransferase n=1 Tax=Chania multitudinisentens RB-25 TaxID=1441930 RepID=W0LFH0_9GAMM|nr:GNAT family N-acetyltransferase [Chania multitudinisentens]AHG21017.1 GNAT family acetyltransferase [Chania multitudinisentens RB-25]